MDTGLTKKGLQEVNEIVSIAFKTLKTDFDKSFDAFLKQDDQKWRNINKFENEVYSHMKKIEESVSKINLEKNVRSRLKGLFYGFLGAGVSATAAVITIIYYIQSIINAVNQ